LGLSFPLISDSFPGADVLHQHFEQHAEEPLVISPKRADEGRVADVRKQARSVYKSSVAESLTGNQVEDAGIATAATEADITNDNDLRGDWNVIIPMFQLQVSDDAPINGRWSVGDVAFVSRNQLPSGFNNTPRKIANGKIVRDWEFACKDVTHDYEQRTDNPKAE
jgi:hypothetical protein